jgi:phosphoglycerate dehydrogenase-like enzyme
MLLPASRTTHQVLSERLLAALPPTSWVVNVGRGSTVDEAALAQAIITKQIAGCALDVFQEEPLPAASPLWRLPNVIISPHAAGGRPIGYEHLIKFNLSALLAGSIMRNVVQRLDYTD